MRRPRRCRRPHQQGRHQQRHRPHTRTKPGRQYGPHPRQAACSIGVKFCAAAPTLFAPREVCASAVKTADPAKANAIARASVTLRICFSPLVAARCPACSSRNGLILLARRFGSTSTIAGMCVSAEIDRPPGQHCRYGEIAKRAIIRSPQNADRAQILWRDCKAGQYPDGMCSFAPTFSARDQIELPLTGPIRQKCHTSVLSDSRLLPKARRSRYLAGITICQNRGDTSAHESPGPTTAGASLFFWPAATLRAAHDRRGSAVQADGRFQR